MRVISCAATGPARADPSPALDRFELSVGGFHADPDIKLGFDTRFGRIDSSAGNQDRVTVPRVKADMLLGDRNGLSFDYFRYDKSFTSALSGIATVNGQQVSGVAALNAGLRLDLAQRSYKGWIGSGNDVFGIGAGAAYYHAEVEGTAQGTLQNISGSASDSASASAFAPLLDLGWRHAFSPGWRMFADASGIRKNGGNINGHFYGAAIGMEWFPYKNMGLVADYGISKVMLVRDGDSATLEIRLRVLPPT